jgi:hypothetical protein
MPTHIRAQCIWQMESLLPRDAVMINPCFRHNPIGGWLPANAQQLADDLAAALKAWEVGPTLHQLTVKLYDIEGTKPVRPMATKVLTPNTAMGWSVPPELSCCLSFYGGVNRPDQRGRLYIPVQKSDTASAAAPRPTSTIRTKIGALAPIFAGLGGIDVDWIVWSKTQQHATQVTNWFVDDDWDVVRSRQSRPSTRTAGTTGG